MSPKQYTPKLPLEVWTKVLENLGKDDQTIMTLWTDYRQVCTAFRDAVDLIFVAKHLPKTWLMFDFDLLWDQAHGNVDLSTEFSLKDVSDDRKLAIFQGIEQDGELRKLQGQMISDALEAATIEKPVPYVQFRRQIHDTEVPGMKFDPESLELTFDWKGMYSSFFAEEKRYETLMKGWTESKKSWIEDMRAKVERGEVDMADSMEQVMKLFARETENVRRDARRARIKRQYLEKQDWHWKADEMDKRAERWILERLKSKRFAASMEEYSDDEEDVEDCEMGDDLVDEDMDEDMEENMDEDREEDMGESGEEDEDEDENENENENLDQD